MKIISTTTQLKEALHQSLNKIGTFEQCALLDYPNHLNIGDHLIWLATVFYLTDVLKAKINYAASIESFSESEMEKRVGKAPIILQGGGNFGDLWPHYQKFRERIISKYCDRPIIIMPQCIYYQDKDNLINTAKIFNNHPNLTIFVRDNYSYNLATEYFPRCQVIKSPDIVFQMGDMPLSLNIKPKYSDLYVTRQDKEFNQAFSSTAIEFPEIVVQDWVTYTWVYRENFQNAAWYWRLPGVVRLVREGWQRRLGHPLEWSYRKNWEVHPYAAKFKDLYNPDLHRNSWSLMHSGLYQLQQSRFIITNRLHVHILSICLGIPHVFLPNAYYKNQAFYETWTSEVPICKFINSPSQVKEAVDKLKKEFQIN